MLTFSDAESKLGNRSSRKLENNTYLERIADDVIGVRLHNTFVVKMFRDGTYFVTSGRFRTATTKDRINSYSPVSIYQKKFDWFIGNGRNSGEEFRDGSFFDADGTLRMADATIS